MVRFKTEIIEISDKMRHDAHNSALISSDWMSVLAKWLKRKNDMSSLERRDMYGNSQQEIGRGVGQTELAGKIYVDFTDLLDFFGHSQTVSGIQRVVLCLAYPALQRGASAVFFDAVRSAWRVVPSGIIDRLWTFTAQEPATQATDWLKLRSDIARAQECATSMTVNDRSLLIILGANWNNPSIFCSLRRLRSQFGLRTATFVHDVVPLLYPEYCQADTRSCFGRWLASSLMQSDIVVVNSEATAVDLRKVSRMLELRRHDPIVCRLNGAFLVKRSEGRSDLSPAVAAAAATPFVLFVGTLEPRKNHLFVLSAWRAAQDMIEPGRVPVLVLVGKLGWDHAQITTAIASHGLRDHVRILDDVSDFELGFLYANCLFTIYNSFHEGWGLPVTESLTYGKIPVVPRHSALVESGGSCAEFFEPGSQKDFLSIVSRLLSDPEYTSRKSEELISRSGIRQWDAISHELIDALLRVETRVSGLPIVEPGAIIRICDHLGDGTLVQYALAEGIRADGWYDLEDWGCWSAKSTSRLAFQFGANTAEICGLPGAIPDPPGFVLLHLLCKTSLPSTALSIFVNGRRCTRSVIVQGRQVVQIETRLVVGQDVDVAVTQDRMEDLSERTEGADRRSIGFGLEGVMICFDTDTDARLRLLEFQAGYQRTKT